MKFLGIKEGGKGVWFQKVLISRREFVKVNLLASWKDGGREEWYLATNFPSEKEAKRIYRLRMRIEECFRDKKSRMGLKNLWLWKGSVPDAELHLAWKKFRRAWKPNATIIFVNHQ